MSIHRKGIECNLAGLSGVSLSEIEEGDEPEEFWKAIGGKKYYCSLAHGRYFTDLIGNSLQVVWVLI